MEDEQEQAQREAVGAEHYGSFADINQRGVYISLIDCLDELKLTAAVAQHVQQMRAQGIHTPLKGLQNEGLLGNGLFAGCFRVSTAQGWIWWMCVKRTPLLPKDDSAGAAYNTKGAINEAQALSYLTLVGLSNVVKIWGVHLFGGSMLTLLEFAPGGTLEREAKGYVSEGGVVVEEAPREERCVEIVRVMLRTSEGMKRCGVLHLDMKPGG